MISQLVEKCCDIFVYLYMENTNQIVYLFRHKGTNFVKIGMTSKDDCSNRFQAFCTYSPWGGEIVGTIICSNARELERNLHKEYASKKSNGEFFILTDEDCQFILKKHDERDYTKLFSKIIEKFKTKEEINSLYNLICNSIQSEEEEIENRLDLSLFFYHDEESKMTSTDISDYMKKNHDLKFSPTQIGRFAKHKFKSKRIYYKGHTKTVYFMHPIVKN